MLKLEIQGYEDPLEIENIVFDYNGTLAVDGRMSRETREGISRLGSAGFNLTVLTADTFGTVKDECSGLPVEVRVFDKGNAEESKRRIVSQLESGRTAAIGNGRNDMAMLGEARIGIAIIGQEGAFTGLLQSAHIAVTSIEDAIGLFLNPKRIEATLRR
ncbi:HAD family hydrolase [Gudongella sp. SC589]|uniref:HAD family hydrolase n=1 Tax=Gudongella sp. SC589 TaxID=3385990 RepID=UPI00390471C0